MSEVEVALEYVPFAFAAAIAPALGSEITTTTVRLLRHGPDAISVEIEADSCVGVTFWTDGQAEMTWLEPGTGDRPQLATYRITTPPELHQFLLDLRARLHG